MKPGEEIGLSGDRILIAKICQKIGKEFKNCADLFFLNFGDFWHSLAIHLESPDHPITRSPDSSPCRLQ